MVYAYVNYSMSDHNPNALRDFVAGCTQATLVTIVGYPFDFTKAQLQIKNYSTNWECIKGTVMKSGPLGFYKGGSMPLVSHLVKRPVQFPIAEAMKKKAKKNEWLAKNQYLYNYFIGGATGPIGTIPGTPMQVIKVRSQVSDVSTGKHIVDVWRESGVRGFYRGFVPTLMKDSLFGASFVGHYYTLRDLVGNEVWWKRFFNGATAHCLTWALLIPIDFVKTNMQGNTSDGAKKGVMEVISTSYRTHGIRVFWKGVVPACLRTIPVSGIAMTGYELVRDNWPESQ